MKKRIIFVVLLLTVLSIAAPTPGHARGWGWWGPGGWATVVPTPPPQGGGPAQ